MTRANAAAAVADLAAFGMNTQMVQTDPVADTWEVIATSGAGLDDAHLATVATTYSATKLTLSAKFS